MKVVALISGGKDSCYNMIECVRNGHEIVALANLKPNIEGEIDSWMYQSVAQVSFITILLIIKILYEYYSLLEKKSFCYIFRICTLIVLQIFIFKSFIFE